MLSARTKHRVGRWKRYLAPLCVLLVGMTIGGYYGLDYAKQTVWRSAQHISAYEPSSTATSFEKTKQTVSQRSALWSPPPSPGQKIGDIKIPRLQLDVPVVEGTEDPQLKLGAGHYTGSALPGEGGNVFIAGHRDTVFTKLKDLKVGDNIVLTTPYGDFVYQAVKFQIVSEYDTYVLAPTDYETLTLSTCYPFNYIGSAPDRYIVYTKLVSEPKSVTAAPRSR